MTTAVKPKTIFTTEILKHFKKELEKAGGFEELMFEKKALERKGDSTLIARYPNKEKDYKRKFLIGEYGSLWQQCNTEVPYVFWAKLYRALKAKYPKIQ